MVDTQIKGWKSSLKEGNFLQAVKEFAIALLSRFGYRDLLRSDFLSMLRAQFVCLLIDHSSWTMLTRLYHKNKDAYIVYAVLDTSSNFHLLRIALVPKASVNRLMFTTPANQDMRKFNRYYVQVDNPVFCTLRVEAIYDTYAITIASTTQMSNAHPINIFSSKEISAMISDFINILHPTYGNFDR